MRSTVLLTVPQPNSVLPSSAVAMPAVVARVILLLVPLMAGDLIHGTVAAKEATNPVKPPQ
jgi:hypothetical protein